jgi:hypothetical protein
MVKTENIEYQPHNFYGSCRRRIGVVSHIKFQHRKIHTWVDLYLKHLKDLYDRNTGENLVYCIGDNNYGLDFYMKTNWKRIGLDFLPTIGYDLGGSKNNLSKLEKKKLMYKKLIDNTNGIIYLKHPHQPEINSFGYLIGEKCKKLGKIYIEIPLYEDEVYSESGLNSMGQNIIEVLNILSEN